ncbi:MAG: SIS domain-containing protein [Patescibacteria group bacterium]
MDTSPVRDYLQRVQETLPKLDMGKISALLDLLMKTYKAGGTIYIFGNAGSGATASHVCGDFIKGISYGLAKRFKMMCLNDNLTALMAIANDNSYDDIFVEQLMNFLGEKDLVIGISGSGNSKNVVKALEYANGVGAKTVAFCGYTGGKIKDTATLAIHVPVMDMEISESVHMMIFHSVKQTLMKELGHSFKMGTQYDARVM